MIYLLSDMHGYDNFESVKKYASENHENDLLIILGDVGLEYAEREDFKEFTKEFLSLKCPIAFIDGNHENFDFLETFPLIDYCGGKVRKITDNIVWLQRGNIYNIEGKSIFTFGSCKSGAKWEKMGLVYPQELPTSEQVDFAIENLKKANNEVDYILTHKRVDFNDETEPQLKCLFEYLFTKVKFKKWFAGHWHFDNFSNPTFPFVYDKLRRLE